MTLVCIIDLKKVWLSTFTSLLQHSLRNVGANGEKEIDAQIVKGLVEMLNMLLPFIYLYF
jgi:hypothetical protein